MWYLSLGFHKYSFIICTYIRMHRYYVKVETSWYLCMQQYKMVNEIQSYSKIRNIKIYKLLLLGTTTVGTR